MKTRKREREGKKGRRTSGANEKKERGTEKGRRKERKKKCFICTLGALGIVPDLSLFGSGTVEITTPVWSSEPAGQSVTRRRSV